MWIPKDIFTARCPGEATSAICRHDRRLGEILDTLETNRLLDQTNIIVLGDHYQKDTFTAIYINYWFLQKGWITVKSGRLSQWQVYCKNCDGSAYVYIRKGFGYLKDAVREVLLDLAGDGDGGIEQVIEGKDAAALGADPHCSFMLEARDGFYFLDGFRSPSRQVDDMNVRDGDEPMRATHGYLPGKPGYQTVFMAKGPDIANKAEILSMCLVDEGPTLARLLGVTLPDADGACDTSTDPDSATNFREREKGDLSSRLTVVGGIAGGGGQQFSYS